MSPRITVLGRSGVRAGWIRDALQKKGCTAEFSKDEDLDLSATDVLWFQDNANWYPRARRQLYRLGRARRPAVMLWHTEPLPFPKDSGFPAPRITVRDTAKIILRDARATDAYTNYYRIRQLSRRGLLDLCVVAGRSRQWFLQEKGIEAQFVPLGYDSRHGGDLGMERDIDALFLGALEDPRHRRGVKLLRSHGIKLDARGSWTDRPIFGDERAALINRARIFVNIQRHPGQYSGFRFILGMANGAMVVSEPIHDPFPYKPGCHYVSTPLEQMADTIKCYLADDAARTEIADAGRRFVTEELTMEKSIDDVIAMMEEMLRKRGVA